MITPDSPVQAVLGDNKKAEKIVSGLKLRTVDDLLHHFPRRYLNTANLTSVADLQQGLMLTVLGEIVDSDEVDWVRAQLRATVLLFHRAGVAPTLFVPPWNNLRPQLLEALPDSAISVVSGFDRDSGSGAVRSVT